MRSPLLYISPAPCTPICAHLSVRVSHKNKVSALHGGGLDKLKIYPCSDVM